MNKLQLTKGELTKIILEEVRNLQEQADPQELAAKAKKEIGEYLNEASADQILSLQAMIAEMDSYE
jgi:hypothetical protein|tara:strand:- start:87 stop:284 length:198 start_codon:yes stop_codon:yes gene_type:complete